MAFLKRNKILLGLILLLLGIFVYLKNSKVDSIEGKWLNYYSRYIKEFKNGEVYSHGFKFGTYEKIDDNTWLITFSQKTANGPKKIQYKMWGNQVSLSMEDYNHRFYRYEANRTLIKYFYEPFGM